MESTTSDQIRWFLCRLCSKGFKGSASFIDHKSQKLCRNTEGIRRQGRKKYLRRILLATTHYEIQIKLGEDIKADDENHGGPTINTDNVHRSQKTARPQVKKEFVTLQAEEAPRAKLLYGKGVRLDKIEPNVSMESKDLIRRRKTTRNVKDARGNGLSLKKTSPRIRSILHRCNHVKQPVSGSKNQGTGKANLANSPKLRKVGISGDKSCGTIHVHHRAHVQQGATNENGLSQTFQPGNQAASVIPMCKSGSKKLHKCEICGYTTSCKSALSQHFRLHTGEKPFTCDLCGFSFTQKGSLKKHMGTHTRGKPFRCHQCSASFSNKSVLNRHIYAHPGGKAFKCDECSRLFSTQSNLRKHERSHPGEKPFKCYVCGKVFPDPSLLKVHKRSHISEKQFKCDLCNIAFSRRTTLKNHHYTHTVEKPFKCEDCSKEFTTRTALMRHKLSHTEEKPFQCGICKISFPIKQVLDRHMFIHTGAKPLSCSLCSCSFLHYRQLKLHTVSHTGEKPFPCKYCSRWFLYRGEFNRHIPSHTGEKPLRLKSGGIH